MPRVAMDVNSIPLGLFKTWGFPNTYSGAVGTYWLALPEPGNLTRKCQRNRGSLSPTPAVMGWTSRGVCALR